MTLTLSYQTRFVLEKTQEEILSACAVLLNSVEHALYAETARGKTPASCKNDFLKKYGITARQFNACRVSVEGKIASCQTLQEQAVMNLEEQLNRLDKQIQRLKKKPSQSFVLHQKNRRKNSLSNRLALIRKNQEQKRIPLCFGGKKLFRAQFHLEKSGFSSHEEWKKAWESKRNSEFFILGSKDETAGNQTCAIKLQEDGKFSVRLRLPNALIDKYGKCLEIKDINFNYCQETILASLQQGRALSYRFKKDHKSWKLFFSTDITKPDLVSQEGRGVIGIDLNVDHIACVETDRFGNLIQKKNFPWVSYGKSKEQVKAMTGDICKEIIQWANDTKKPVVIEQLDFKKKKISLKEQNSKFSRLLSSFSYTQFFTSLASRAFKNGIALHKVNPAYTSIIGRVNYAKRYGLSIHLAAALCIARRYQQFSEVPVSSVETIPDGKGSHVAFALPVRNRAKHVWHFWGQVKRKLLTVLAAHFQTRRSRSLDPPSVLVT